MLVLCLASLVALGCGSQNDGGELPQPSEVQVYQGSWEYRYGDSPRRPDGSLLWAEPSQDDGGWRSAAKTINLPGRATDSYLWLRTRLSGPPVADAAMQVSEIYQSCEVYLDGRKLAQVGQVEGPRLTHFPGFRPLTLALGTDYAGKLLAFRIYSPTFRMGIGPIQRIGSRAALLASQVRRGLSLAIMGIIFVIFAIALLVVSLIRWGQTEYMIFSFTFLSVGVYLVSRSPMRSFIFEEPSLWYHIELGSLCLALIFATLLQQTILRQGRLFFLRWSWRVLLAFFLGSTLLLLLGRVHILSLLLPLEGLVMTTTLLMAISTTLEIRSGNPDARIFGIGLLISAFCIAAELVQSWHWVGRVAVTVPYGAVAYLGSLGVILAQRFRAFNQRRADYSTVLRLSFSSAQDLTPGHQAQIALTELLRMLHAQRGLLFLCNPDGKELKLMAGRHAASGALRDPATHGGYDQSLVDAVMQKRRPFVRELMHQTSVAGERAEPRSAVAAPLLARGQLLGVIYLEGATGAAGFGREDVEILLGLVNQIALTLMATRAGKLESESVQARQRLAERGALLEAAARMARGDLQSAIAVDQKSELGPLAQMLDQLRLDLRAKLDQLELGNAEVRQLNDELRVQLDQRLRRLLDFAQQRDRGAPEDPGTRASAAGFVAGELLVENYRIVRLLGEGTSGSVYEVERTTDGRALAAKVLNKRADKSAAIRFAGEAQILARINHPSVVSIVDVDLTANGLLFLVMELVRGTALSHCQERYGDQRFALEVLKQIAAGLCTVHGHGIVHRDLKPANVLVANSDGQKDGRPVVKLVDFGISTPKDPSGTILPISAPEVLVGTPMYLAPELAAGARHAGPASDIFSFGIIAYEILSGEMPFVVPPVVSRWRGEPISLPQLRSKSPDDPVSESVLLLVELCLAPDPQVRPTAEQILAVLAEVPT